MSKRKPAPNPFNTVELLRHRGDELSLRAAALIETLQNLAYERGQAIRRYEDAATPANLDELVEMDTPY